jgi:hypothetical protein
MWIISKDFCEGLQGPVILKNFLEKFSAITQNRKQIQATFTMSCGFHVVLFILLRAREYSFKAM